MKKNYVVAVKSPSDWPGIHELLLQDGTLEDNIPSHSCECVDEKTTCANRATYLLDDEEVELLSAHPAIKYIELDPHFHPEAYPEVVTYDNRFSGDVKNYRATEAAGSPGVLNPPASSPTIAELNRTGWQLYRLTAKADPWGANYTAVNGAESLNRNFAGNAISANPQYTTGEDGSNVDCVIIDNGVWHGHPEFVDNSGVSQVKDVILDGPYYIDKSYFDNNLKTTTFLGRTTCTEAAALEWWSDATKRSTTFSGIGTITGIPNTYTRANVCGDYSSYPAHASTSPKFANHGTGCASTMYGKTFGWAFNSNKWNIATNIGSVTASGISIAKSFEIVKFFAQNKPVNSLDGKKDPTVVNNSYGYIASVANSFSITAYYSFRGLSGSFTNKTSAPNFLKNFTSDNNAVYATGNVSLSLREDGEELVDLDGVYFFASAGNENQKQVNPGDTDYNNYWSYQSAPTEAQKYYVNRRGFPADISYESSLASYRTFSVSALSGYLDADGKENKDYYSNSGPACDVFAPASGTLSAAGNSNQETFERYDSSSYYSWLNKAAFDCIISGTSTACPVAAGFIASKLSKLRYWNPKRVKSYIKNIVENQADADFTKGLDNIATADSFDWVSYKHLHGQAPKVLYNAAISAIQIATNLPASVTPDASNKITLKVVPGTNTYALSYTYQWEKSTDNGTTWAVISGQIGNSLNISVTSADNGTKYRCLVDADGPYTRVYSSVSTLSAAGTISITTQPPATKSVNVGEKLELSIVAALSNGGELTYQWQKKNPIIQAADQFEDISGATQSLYSVSATTVSDAGEYRCKVSSLIATNSPQTSDVTTVTIGQLTKLSITNQSESLAILYGGSGIIFVSATNGTTDSSTISYQWQKLNASSSAWEDLSGKTKNQVSFSNATEADSGSYRCVVSDSTASNTPLTSATIAVSVRKNTLTLISQTKSFITFVGRNATLEVNAITNSGGEILYQWQKLKSDNTWGDIDGATQPKYLLTNLKTTDAGAYRCRILDPWASNSPITSDVINVIVTEVTLTLAADLSTTFSTIEGGPITISVSAYLNDGREPSFKWEKEGQNLKGDTIWTTVEINSTGVLFIPSARMDSAGKYRCVISDNIANNSPITSKTCVVSVAASFSVSTTSSTILKSVGDTINLDSGVVINNPNLTYRYQWQRRQTGTTTWVDIPNTNSDKYSFTASGSDYLDGFRCEVSNGIGTIKLTGVTTLNLNPFFAITSQPPVKIEFKKNSQQSYDIYPEVESTNLSSITYQWQLSTDNKATWSDISGETDRILSLDPSDILSLSTRDYFLRCKLVFNSDELYTNPTLIDLKSSVNLFGQGACLNADQVLALAAEGVDVNEIYKTDKCKDQNSCGTTVEDLLDTYDFYSTQKGLYASWGNIVFPWDITVPTVTNLNTSETDDKWKIASYKANNAYLTRDKVLLIEDDGFELSLFEALQNVPAISGPFDRSKWNKLCSVKTTIPVGLPTIEELKQRYEFFSLESFLKKWGEVDSKWSAELYNKIYTDCLALHTDLSDIEKCVKEANPTSSNDKWEEYKLKKTNFYEVGDYVLTQGPCEDNLCLYINIRAIPVSEKNFELHKVFSPVVNGVVYWEKVYCVVTGVNKCLGPQSKRDLPNYQLVQIGSEGHYVEQPLPFYELQGKKLYAEYETLNEYSEAPQPKVLTQEEIDAL